MKEFLRNLRLKLVGKRVTGSVQQFTSAIANLEKSIDDYATLRTEIANEISQKEQLKAKISDDILATEKVLKNLKKIVQ